MRERVVPIAATVVLCGATALQFARVFSGIAWFVGLLSIVLVVAVVAVAAPSDGARTALLTLGSVFVAALVVHPADRLVVFPTPRGIGRTFDDLLSAPSALARLSVPITATGSAWLLAVLAMWASTAIAVRAAHGRAPLPLVIGPCAVVAVSAAMAGRRGALLVTAVWLVSAATVVLAVDRAERDRLPRARVSHRRRGIPSTAIVLLAAVGVAVVVSPLFAGGKGLLDYRRIGRAAAPRSIVAVSPMSSLQARLVDPSNPELFRVRADAEARWRLVSLDRYRDGAWVLDNPTVTDELRRIAFPRGVPVTTVHQDYVIGPMRGSFLPAADRPQQIRRTDGHRTFAGMVVVADSGTLVVADEDHDTTRYSVVSQFVAPTPRALHAARLAPAERASLTRSLALPPVDPRVVELARTIVRGAADPYAQALALQRFFRDPQQFRYDTSVDLSESSDALTAFLFDTRAGFCQQFASAYAVMARLVGLPTRVAVGFLPGTVVGGEHVVHSRDAHAWPEVWFGGIGWVPIEPTPTRSATNAPGGGPGVGATTTTSTSAATSTTTVPTTTSPGTATTAPRSTTTSNAESSGASAPTAVAVTVVLGTVVVALGAVPWARRIRRRRRRTRGSPAARIERAWTTTLARLQRIGVTPDATLTPIEFASTVAAARGAGSAAPSCKALAELHAVAAYGAAAPDDATADRAWDLVESLEAALRDDAQQRTWRVRLQLWW